MAEGRSMRERSGAPSSGVFRLSMYMCLATNFSYTRLPQGYVNRGGNTHVRSGVREWREPLERVERAGRANAKKQGVCAGSQTHHASRGEPLLGMPEAITALCDHFPAHGAYPFASDQSGPLWVSLSSPCLSRAQAALAVC